MDIKYKGSNKRGAVRVGRGHVTLYASHSFGKGGHFSNFGQVMAAAATQLACLFLIFTWARN